MLPISARSRSRMATSADVSEIYIVQRWELHAFNFDLFYYSPIRALQLMSGSMNWYFQPTHFLLWGNNDAVVGGEAPTGV
jgi:hypothetical protein